MPSASNDSKIHDEKKKHLVPMIFFGCLSLTSYYFLLTSQTLVTDVFTRGGWYAAWPIVVAFFFSFIHGAFASNLLSFFGIEAKK